MTLILTTNSDWSDAFHPIELRSVHPNNHTIQHYSSGLKLKSNPRVVKTLVNITSLYSKFCPKNFLSVQSSNKISPCYTLQLPSHINHMKLWFVSLLHLFNFLWERSRGRESCLKKALAFLLPLITQTNL